MSQSNIRYLLLLLLATTGVAFAQGNPALREDAPDRYIVERGDTLWGIAQRFLDRFAGKACQRAIQVLAKACHADAGDDGILTQNPALPRGTCIRALSGDEAMPRRPGS